MSKTITIQGTVTRVERMNPHARLRVATKNGDATVSNWELELPPPNALKRMLGELNGTSRDFVKRGDRVSVTLWRAKDGAMAGTALSMVLADGRAVNLPSGWL